MEGGVDAASMGELEIVTDAVVAGVGRTVERRTDTSRTESSDLGNILHDIDFAGSRPSDFSDGIA